MSRRLLPGLATVLGLARLGFFIPHRHAGSVLRAGRRPRYEALAPLFRAAEGAMGEVFERIDSFAPALEAIGDEPPPAPRWTQDWFPRLDAAAAYALVRHHRPARIVEVGCGHSTRFLARAVKDAEAASEIVSIDPAPRAAIAALPIRHIETAVQEADPTLFAVLEADDVLFIDSSHVLMPGTDVDVLFNRVLPRLPAGVLIHVHDIFLPRDYPLAWDWRAYNEQLGIAALLQGGGYEILFASAYAVEAMAVQLEAGIVARLPLVDGAIESSLWLRKRASA